MWSLCRCVASWGARSDWGEGRSFLHQSVVCTLCLRPFHADWRKPGIFLPSLSHQALPPPTGRQRAPVTWRQSLGCACSAISTGRRARKRDVLLWGRILRHLDRNVPSRNIHPVAHSSQPDWGNGSRGCFTKGLSESYYLPTGLTHRDRTVPRSSLLRWLKQILLAGSVAGSDPSAFPLLHVTGDLGGG